MGVHRLIVFLRAPQLGKVKTRLAAGIGPEAALAAYRHLVELTLRAVSSWPDVELRFTPDEAAGEMSGWSRSGWKWIPQGGGDLGERLDRAVTATLAHGGTRVVVIGTDCPFLKPDDLKAAFAALESVDLVLGPATDGGYWLIGLRRSCPAVFQEISWGSSQVRTETLQRAAEAGLSVRLLRALSDVDTPDDWTAFLRGPP